MEADHFALDPGWRVADDRTPGVRASLIGKATHLPTFRLDMLEEGERLPLLSGTEETQGEDFAVLDQGVSASIALDADHYLRWLEGTLRRPVDRSQGHFVTLLGTKHLETIGNHQQCGLFRLLVHDNVSFYTRMCLTIAAHVGPCQLAWPTLQPEREFA